MKFDLRGKHFRKINELVILDDSLEVYHYSLGKKLGKLANTDFPLSQDSIMKNLISEKKSAKPIENKKVEKADKPKLSVSSFRKKEKK